MRPYIIVLLAIFLLSPAYSALAEVDTEPASEKTEGDVVTTPQYKVGEKFLLEIYKKREERGGKNNGKRRSKTTVDVEVLEVTEEGFVLAWTFVDMSVLEANEKDSSTFEAMARVIRGMRLDLNLDPKGTVLGIRNWSEVQLKADEIVEKTIELVGDSVAGKSKREHTIRMMRQMFASRRVGQQSFLREAYVYFMPVGYSFSESKPFDYTEQVPAPGSKSDILPSHAQFAVTKYDKNSGLANIAWKQRIDPEAMAKLADKRFRAHAKKMNKRVPKDAVVPTIDLYDRATFAIDTKTGWVSTAEHVRTTTNGKHHRVETMKIVRKPLDRAT